jgi:hypothetical protein
MKAHTFHKLRRVKGAVLSLISSRHQGETNQPASSALSHDLRPPPLSWGKVIPTTSEHDVHKLASRNLNRRRQALPLPRRSRFLPNFKQALRTVIPGRVLSHSPEPPFPPPPLCLHATLNTLLVTRSPLQRSIRLSGSTCRTLHVATLHLSFFCPCPMSIITWREVQR